MRSRPIILARGSGRTRGIQSDGGGDVPRATGAGCATARVLAMECNKIPGTGSQLRDTKSDTRHRFR